MFRFYENEIVFLIVLLCNTGIPILLNWSRIKLPTQIYTNVILIASSWWNWLVAFNSKKKRRKIFLHVLLYIFLCVCVCVHVHSLLSELMRFYTSLSFYCQIVCCCSVFFFLRHHEAKNQKHFSDWANLEVFSLLTARKENLRGKIKSCFKRE